MSRVEAGLGNHQLVDEGYAVRIRQGIYALASMKNGSGHRRLARTAGKRQGGLLFGSSRLDDQDGDLKADALLQTGVLEQISIRLNEGLHILTKAAPLFDLNQHAAPLSVVLYPPDELRRGAERSTYKAYP